MQESPRPAYRVSDLLRDARLGLSLLAGESGTGREITRSRLQKPGLILAGHLEHLNPEKIQVLGATEISHLSGLEEERLGEVAGRLMALPVVCFVATKGLRPPEAFLRAAEGSGIPVLQSREHTSALITELTAHLESVLAPRASVHGVLMSIQGVGVLILGKSGVGKSECALDLVAKGHRLVADDLIYLRRIGREVIVGQGPEIIKHHMEIRGLGIINVKDLFGVVSVMDSTRVDLVIELSEWSASAEHDRLGLEEGRIDLLEVSLPRIDIPVSPGRNLSVILEVAARNHLLKKSGYNAPRSVQAALEEALRKSAGDGGLPESGP